MRAVEVKALNNYKINVVFNDGVSGVVDLNDLIQRGIFQKLKDVDVFQKVYVDGEAIAWSDELEIDALNIYAKIVNKDPSELVEKNFAHATD